MTITTKITSSEIDGTRLISRNSYADYYYYVEATISANIDIDGKDYNITLQTGLGYDNNDYNCPSNNLRGYDNGTDSLLYNINRLSEDEFDDETVTEINEFCETAYTIEKMLEIRNAIAELIGDAQNIIAEAEREAEEQLDADENIYVHYHTREKVEGDEEGAHEWQQDSPAELKTFDNEDDANKFIENAKDYEIAYIICKELARSQFSADF